VRAKIAARARKERLHEVSSHISTVALGFGAVGRAEQFSAAGRAGDTIVKPARRAQWGRSSGSSTDPDGYLWKIVSGNDGDQGTRVQTRDASSE
jgi:uncharacterized glyoxalase superfamily protein PhnB